MSIKFYNVEIDELVDITQEWCEAVQNSCNRLALQRELIRKISSLHINDEKLDKIKEILGN